MKKLRLHLDALAVDSFATAGHRGMIGAHDAIDGSTRVPCTGATYDNTLCGVSQACSNLPVVC